MLILEIKKIYILIYFKKLTLDPRMGVFVALGSGPGKTEASRWIFKNDMTRTLADDA